LMRECHKCGSVAQDALTHARHIYHRLSRRYERQGKRSPSQTIRLECPGCGMRHTVEYYATGAE
jgi:uncharacterized Zn finger protein